ncbi:MAG: UDP-N-acetylglucosamine diphosphorylase/glucosamine-1-phosphate N-acetyltransferase [bacterium]|nr:UDP-N-acetylglucosamine diphosphorylase/glucosamine-1-phosphate N-acetyltransferase [bacterium]
MAPSRRVAVVLAAGKGTRLRSDLPKVLHPVGGRPMIEWVLDATRGAGCEQTLVVVGHGAEQVREAIDDDSDIVWVEQHQQLGTGHALAQAEPHVEGDAILLVLYGDVPLVSVETLDRLSEAAAAGWGAMAAAELEDAGWLGRVITGPGGDLERIVEVPDAGPEELAVRLGNAGIYALPSPGIFDYLRRLEPANAQGELYLTDAVGDAAVAGDSVSVVRLGDPSEALGINDRADQARAHRALLERHMARLMAAGVTILEPARTVVEAGVRVGAETVIHPGVSLLGMTEIGAGCVLHQGAWIRDSKLADGVEVKPYSVFDRAEVADGCTVGPFARLRPASVLMEGARVGNFVEVKKTRIGAGSKASHLTYLGDATIGDGANIGAGVVTCNYDGAAKHQTEIGDGAFVGSDTMLVAPVRVGREATTAAGSTITDDVPDEALGVGRSRQRNIPGWARRMRKKIKRS